MREFVTFRHEPETTSINQSHLGPTLGLDGEAGAAETKSADNTETIAHRETREGYPHLQCARFLDSAEQQQDDQDQDDESDTTARVIAPAAAVGPRGQADDEKDDQDEEYQGASAHELSPGD
jgi:hypothetical protein